MRKILWLLGLPIRLAVALLIAFCMLVLDPIHPEEWWPDIIAMARGGRISNGRNRRSGRKAG